MLDYLAESIAISFVFGTMLGVFVAMQFSATTFGSTARKPKSRD